MCPLSKQVAAKPAKPAKQEVDAKPTSKSPVDGSKRVKKEEPDVKHRVKKEEREEKKPAAAKPLESFRNKAEPRERKRLSDASDDVKIVSPAKKQRVVEGKRLLPTPPGH